MALVIRAVAPTQARSGSGTQDFTISGFGTPQAAIIFYHSYAADNTDVAPALLGVGLYDGTSSVCAVHLADDAINPTTNSHHDDAFWTSYAAYVYDYTGSDTRTATAAWTTDGLRLTWDAGVTRPAVTVVLIKGAVGAKVGTYTPNATAGLTTVTSSLGFNPNFLLNLGTWKATSEGLEGDLGLLALGVASKVGSTPYVQRCHAVHWYGAAATTQPGSILSSNRVGLVTSYGGATITGLELTDFGTGAFTITTRADAGSVRAALQGYLALECGYAPDVFTATAPTSSSGTWDPYTGNGTPVGVLMFPTAHTATDSFVSSGDATGVQGFYVVTPSEEYGAMATYEDAVATSNASARRNTLLLVQGDEGGTPKFTADGPTLDTSGLVYGNGTFTAAPAAYKIIGVSFYDSALTRKLKLLAHPSAVGASSVAGVVFSAPAGGAITGTTRYGEFTGGTFAAGTGGDSGYAVLKVAVSSFGGDALTTSDTPVALARTATYTTGVVSCTVIEE